MLLMVLGQRGHDGRRTRRDEEPMDLLTHAANGIIAPNVGNLHPRPGAPGGPPRPTPRDTSSPTAKRPALPAGRQQCDILETHPDLDWQDRWIFSRAGKQLRVRFLLREIAKDAGVDVRSKNWGFCLA